MVVGELAGLKNARKYGTSISEFFDGLPDDVVCNAGVFAQHQYSKRGAAANDPGAVGELEKVLDRRPCAKAKPIWVTESGVGGPHVGDQRSPKDESIRADCQALNVSLRRWNNDPRVDAVFQYTFRDDPVFPVGLADAKLSKAWPAYELFKAWGGQRKPDDPAPALPAGLQGLTAAWAPSSTTSARGWPATPRASLPTSSLPTRAPWPCSRPRCAAVPMPSRSTTATRR